ncbi:MAG: PAS domain-containing protein, partial [Pseudomonadota bacterium]|nr:PAS domain-containing protein [Pseudomonadota bacterium]
GGIVAILAGTLSARRFVLGPLSRIAAAADRVGEGDLNARADLGRRSGELRELGAGFDRMITALACREQERDQAEAALRREEARLRLALEAGRLGSFAWDLTTQTIEPSDRLRAMFGMDPTEGRVPSDFSDRIVLEDRAKAAEDIRAGIAAGRVVHSYRITRGGEHRHLVIQAETVRDATGNPFLTGLVSDETEHFANVSALRESESRFQAIVNCIDQMVWSTRPDGYHDYFNQRWYEFTGTDPGSTSGKSWVGVFHPDDRAETERIWAASLSTGRPYHREYRLKHNSGRYRWVLARAQAIQDDQGRILRWYGTCTDIDEIVEARNVLAQSREALTAEIADRTADLMAAEEQLRQSQKMEAVGQLTGGIAHDFNNMLQAIGGALELLVRRVDQNKLDDAKRFAAVARTTVDRAASLTHRLLAFARRQTLTPETVDVATLVDGMAELIARTVGPAIDLSTRHGPGATWTVLCDVSQLENVIFNLCINARDAMPGGGKLTITTANISLLGSEIGRGEGVGAGDYVEIAVTDTGAGMDEATQARAFEPFFTTKPVGQGTGLGLSQVYGFVRQSGGFVRLESQLGQGATVHLHLPRHDRPAPDRPVPDADETSDKPVILLVEEDAAVRDAAARHVRRLGYGVRVSAGGADALLLLTGGLPRLDLLITNVGLPGNLNGRQIAEAARQAWPTLPVLFITNYTGALGDARLAPGMSIIAKPIPPEILADRIRDLLAPTSTPV